MTPSRCLFVAVSFSVVTAARGMDRERKTKARHPVLTASLPPTGFASCLLAWAASDMITVHPQPASALFIGALAPEQARSFALRPSLAPWISGRAMQAGVREQQPPRERSGRIPEGQPGEKTRVGNAGIASPSLGHLLQPVALQPRMLSLCLLARNELKILALLVLPWVPTPQDAWVVKENFGNTNGIFFGVFDGHGYDGRKVRVLCWTRRQSNRSVLFWTSASAPPDCSDPPPSRESGSIQASPVASPFAAVLPLEAQSRGLTLASDLLLLSSELPSTPSYPLLPLPCPSLYSRKFTSYLLPPSWLGC